MTGSRILDGIAVAGLILIGFFGIGALLVLVSTPSSVGGASEPVVPPAPLEIVSGSSMVSTVFAVVRDSETGCEYLLVQGNSGRQSMVPRAGRGCAP